MSVQRKRYSAELKARVALEVIKKQKTAYEIAAEYGVHPTQIAQWKKQALDGLPELFSLRREKQETSEEALIASLYQQIGQLKVQVDWLEKNQSQSVEVKRTLIETEHPSLSIRQQCSLLSGLRRRAEESHCNALYGMIGSNGEVR